MSSEAASLIWKDILHPGRVYVPHPARPDDLVPLDITPEDVANACRLGNRKTAQDWHVPGCWEHDDAARPDRAAQLTAAAKRSLGVWGYAKRFRLREDAAKGHVLQAGLSVGDTVDRAQLAKTKFVSPYIQWDWKNPGTGETWPGMSVLHIAATGVPRQGNQRPFPLSQGGVRTTIKGPFRLSYGDDTMDPTTMQADPAAAAQPAAGMDPGAFAALLDIVGNKWGMVLPPDTTPETFAANFFAALQQEDAQPDPALQPQSPPPAQAAAMSQAVQRATDKAVAVHRNLLAAEVIGLMKSGAITPKIAGNLKARVTSAKLSFDDAGELVRNLPVVVEIDAYARLPKGTSWRAKGVKLSQSDRFTAVGVPEELTADERQRADKEADAEADSIVATRKK